MKNISLRFIHLFRAANAKFENAPPIFVVPICAIIGAIMYGLPMGAIIALSNNIDGDSAAWAALLLGFPALFLIPSAIEQALTTQEFLILVLFTEGALFGGLGGCILLIVRPAEIPLENDIDDSLK